MGKTAAIAALVVSFAALASCSFGTKGDNPAYELRLNYALGSSAPDNPIYVAWIENTSGDFVQYIYTCERLLNDSEKPNIPTKSTCPYWRKRIYENSKHDSVDTVSGATIAAGATFSDFTKAITLPAGSPLSFTVYFEIDHSFDGNDWWTDQPAVVYAADVTLDGSTTKTFVLTARGWSRNAGGGSGGNTNKASSDFPNATEIGELVTEMRYITNHAELGSELFGAAYAAGSAEDATNMVGSLTITITKK